MYGGRGGGDSKKGGGEVSEAVSEVGIWILWKIGTDNEIWTDDSIGWEVGNSKGILLGSRYGTLMRISLGKSYGPITESELGQTKGI